MLSALDARNDLAKAAEPEGFCRSYPICLGSQVCLTFFQLFILFLFQRKQKRMGEEFVLPLVRMQHFVGMFIDVPFAMGLQEAHGLPTCLYE